uniref:Bm110 n=1 Tax=Brugia malayi TaxID=6279 RepID=A0A0J9XLZ4_BRUMA|nr:Bm110 [Brugia malayi]
MLKELNEMKMSPYGVYVCMCVCVWMKMLKELNEMKMSPYGVYVCVCVCMCVIYIHTYLNDVCGKFSKVD